MTKKQRKVFIRIIAATVLVAAIAILTHFVQGMNRYVQLALYMIPYLVIGYDILRKAFLGIVHGKVFDENFLMAIATLGAIALGEYREGVAVMLFYQVGELFQSCAVGKSRRNIAALMDIRPDYANIEVDGKLEQVPPDDVEIGTVILVQPGEKVPIDGVILEGSSTLNTSALTGESVPREAGPGDEIISGCVNLTGVLRIRTTRNFGESTVSRILNLVENSSMKKAKTENFITRFTKYYTPAVCGVALAIAVLPPVWNILAGNPGNWTSWITNALTMLVISCPCALVISIPLSFFGGIGGASAKGILIKGSNYLEALARASYVVCDKTGTLTKGVFEVVQTVAAAGFSEEELLEAAVYAENYSNHPISKSLKEAYRREVDASRISEVEEITGYGVKAVVDGRQIAVGNRKLMEQFHIPYGNPRAIGTEVHVAVDGAYAGYVLIADVEKPNAKAAIDSMKQAGVKQVIMLTGDTGPVAEDVAARLGVDVVRSELLPADKVREVESLLEAKGDREQLAFVGDGINDAPVLSRADIGIAMGALGSDAAIEAADIVLMDDDPMKIATAMKISRKTLRIVHQNIVFALGVKLVCLALGAVGFLNMWWAIFADVGVMVLAVLNATRALRCRE